MNLEKSNLSKGTDQKELTKVLPFWLFPAAEYKWKQCLLLSLPSPSGLYKEMLLLTLPGLYLPHKLALQDWQKRFILFQIACEVMFLSSQKPCPTNSLLLCSCQLKRGKNYVRRNIDADFIYWHTDLRTVNDSKCYGRGKLFPLPSSTCQSYDSPAPSQPLWAAASDIISWRTMSPTDTNPFSSGVCVAVRVFPQVTHFVL